MRKIIDAQGIDRGPMRFFLGPDGMTVNHWDLTMPMSYDWFYQMSGLGVVRGIQGGFRFTVVNGEAEYRIVRDLVEACRYDLALIEGWVKDR